jgi:hypothetical protein
MKNQYVYPLPVNLNMTVFQFCFEGRSVEKTDWQNDHQASRSVITSPRYRQTRKGRRSDTPDIDIVLY